MPPTVDLRVRLLGFDEARAYFATLRDGAEALGRLSILVGSPLGYAKYQEFGTRRMAGRYFLTRGLESVQDRIAPELLAAVPKGPQAVLDTGLGLGYRVQRVAQSEAPVRTGALRRSLHTVIGRR